MVLSALAAPSLRTCSVPAAAAVEFEMKVEAAEAAVSAVGSRMCSLPRHR